MDLEQTRATTMTRSRFSALWEGDALVHPASWAQDEARLHACMYTCNTIRIQKKRWSGGEEIVFVTDSLAGGAAAVHPAAGLRLDVVLLALAEVAEHPPRAAARSAPAYAFFLGTNRFTARQETHAAASALPRPALLSEVRNTVLRPMTDLGAVDGKRRQLGLLPRDGRASDDLAAVPPRTPAPWHRRPGRCRR
jgi:hypothetical protein|uniref:Uncharacterized protein n=1 Tax=Zea mays TaxID=4577 RepID=A0A804LTL0_MAIZE